MAAFSSSVDTHSVLLILPECSQGGAVSNKPIRSTDEIATAEALELANTSRLIVSAVLQLGRRLRAQRPASSVGLSQLGVLATLHRLGAMPAARLAEHEALQPQSLTRVIAEMQAAGFIVRRRSTTDRRALIIELSRKGTMVLADDIRARRAWLERAMAVALTPTERTMLKLSAELMLKVAASEGAQSF
jgi:DNA-binding MarR family transcriptional regulator